MVSARRTKTWPSPEEAPWHPERCSRFSTWIMTVIHADTYYERYLGSMLCGILPQILLFGPLPPPTLYSIIARHPQTGQVPSFLLFLACRALDSGSCDEPVLAIVSDQTLKPLIRFTYIRHLRAVVRNGKIVLGTISREI